MVATVNFIFTIVSQSAINIYSCGLQASLLFNVVRKKHHQMQFARVHRKQIVFIHIIGWSREYGKKWLYLVCSEQTEN